MARDQRRILRDLVEAAESFLVMRRGLASAPEHVFDMVGGREVAIHAVESTLDKVVDQALALDPRVRAALPAAPWGDLSGLRGIGIFRRTGLEEMVDWGSIEETVAQVRTAASEILAELEENGLSMPPATRQEPSTLRLRVTLSGVEPPIWRLVQVPNDLTLPRLHQVLQEVCGWTDSHLHRFEIAGTSYSQPDPDWPDDSVSEKRVRLHSLNLAPGTRFTYVYDYGDDWEHGILVEEVEPQKPPLPGPRCLGGARAFPPEDCGGPPGYEHLLEVLADPAHEEFESLSVWVGPYFDPEAFSCDEVNEQLAGGTTGRAGPRGLTEPAEGAQMPLYPTTPLSPGSDPAHGGPNVVLVPLPDPRQADILLGAHIGDPAGPVRLHEDLPPEELVSSLHLYNARTFLSALVELGSEGVKATATGNLSRAFVQELWPRLCLDEEQEGWRFYIKPRSEDDVWPLHLTRVLLRLGGLIRKHKGRFVITRAGERLLPEAGAGTLQARLFRTAFGKFNLGYLDAMAEDPALQQDVPYMLWILQQLPADWLTAPQLHDVLLRGIRLRPVTEQGPYGDDPIHPFEHRFLKQLEWFGVLESRQTESAGERPRPLREREFRSTPLLRRMIVFEF